MMQKGTLLSRLTALLLLLLLCVAVFVIFVEPLIVQARLYDDSLSTIREQRARFATEAAALPGLRSQIKALRKTPGPRNEYIEGDTESRAAASLLETVKTTVSAGGATLVSAQVLSKPDSPAQPGSPARIAVRAQMKASSEALQHIFHRLESGRPTLFMDEVSITGRHIRHSRRNRTRQAKPQDSVETLTLDVRFVVTGFMRQTTPEAQ